jgi:hypothetical protein
MPYLHEFVTRSYYIDRKIEACDVLNFLAPMIGTGICCNRDLDALREFYYEIAERYYPRGSKLGNLELAEIYKLCRILAHTTSWPWSLPGSMVHKAARGVYEELGEQFVRFVGNISLVQFERYHNKLIHGEDEALSVLATAAKPLAKESLLSNEVLAKLFVIFDRVKASKSLCEAMQQRFEKLAEAKRIKSFVMLVSVCNDWDFENLVYRADILALARTAYENRRKAYRASVEMGR